MIISNFMKDSVQIESYTETQDGSGQPVKSWTLSSTINAFINENSGGKQIKNDQEIVTSNGVMICDSSVSITEKNRIKVVETGKYYDVLYVNKAVASHNFRKIYLIVDLRYSKGAN